MKTTEAIAYYGSKAALARALRLTRGAITRWGEEPPVGRQHQLQALTLGQLRADDPVLHRRREAAE
jgi:3-deoxy-7-phosphoheptulonate synthase